MVNQEVQVYLASSERKDVALLNPFSGRGHVAREERERRQSFRTREATRMVEALIAAIAPHLE